MNNPLYYVAPQFTWQFDTPMLCKGPSDLQKQTGQTAYSTAGGLQGNAGQLNQFLVPQLESEVTNPQGFGQLGLNELETATGQNVAGQVGAGKEAALLRSSRLGNPSSSSSIIDALTRSGMTQLSNNARNANVANLEAKLQQRGQGLSGLESLQKADQSGALEALGLTNTTEKDIAQEQNQAFQSWFSPLMGLGGAIAGAAGQALSGRGGGSNAGSGGGG